MARRKKADLSVDTSEFIGMIRRFLHENDMQQAELAAKAEIQEPVLSRLLSDAKRRPEPETVVALARAMGKPMWDVAVAAGYPFAAPGQPSQEAERLLRLMDDDPRLRDALIDMYRSVTPERRESLLAFLEAMRAFNHTHHRPSE